MNTSTVNFSTLSNKIFLLKQVDDVQVTLHEGRQPEIAFADNGRVTGAMCNRFFGQGEFSGAKLTVKNLASTMMLCPQEQLNQWDNMIGDELAKGVEVSLNGQILTLKGVNHRLVYQQK
ncbi:META domain-containing protein [Enterobacteriaceae bacterium LUAb1]